MKKKRVLALLLVFALALGLAACGSSDTSEAASDASEDTAAATTEEAAPAEDTAEEEAAPAEETASGGSTITSLNVGTANVLGDCLLASTTGDCYTAINLVFDSIFTFDPFTQECYSDVLSDWGYSDDGMTLTMTLKDGVTFSNGAAATAEDVVYSLQNYVDRDTTMMAFFIPYDFDNAVYSDDGLTVEIPMTTEFSPLITEVGNLPLYCKEWSETATDQDWINDPVCSGPYKVVDYVTDSHIDLELRDDYWGDYDTTIENVRLYTYGEPSTMAMALEEGEIDLALMLLDTDYQRLSEEDGFATDIISTGENRFLSLNYNTEVLQDENVRKAIAYGVNWEELADAADGGISPLATSLIVSRSDYYEDVGAYEYDYDKAMEYLNASDYAGQEINLTIVTTEEDAQIKMAVVMQAYLADLGINLDVQSMDFTSAIVLWLNNETDMMWTDSSIGSIIADPYASIRATGTVTGTIPPVIVHDDEYQALLDEGIYTFDSAVRHEAFNELQEYNKEHVCAIPVTEDSIAIAWNTDVIESVNILSGIDVNLRNLVLK